MNLLILFNQDWSAELTKSQTINGWAKTSSFKSQDLPLDQQAVLDAVIQGFRGLEAEWMVKQANVQLISICTKEATFDEQGNIIQEAVYQDAVGLTLYAEHQQTKACKWLTSQDMEGLVLTSPEVLGFWNCVKDSL